MITYRRKTTKRSGEHRRQEILEAARKLVAEAGVRGATMRDLAREVGFTEGAVYRHFRSKEEIVAELFSSEAVRLHGWLSRCLAGAGTDDPWERLDSLVRGMMDFAIEQSLSFRLIVAVHTSGATCPIPRVRLPRELFIEVLGTISKRERLPVPDPSAIVLMIVGMVSRLSAGIEDGMVKLSRSESVEFVVRAVRAVVHVAGAGSKAPPLRQPRRRLAGEKPRR